MIENFALGVSSVFTWANLIVIIIGVCLGIFAGALPGLSATIAVALAVPFTYKLAPLTSLILLCAIYTAAEYGGSISAIAVNTPGTPCAAITGLDGYPLAQQGFPGKALGYAVIASTIGGIFSTIALVLLAVPLATVALQMGPPEYFAVGVLGLTVVSSMAGKAWLKAFIGMLLGLILVVVGIDPISGLPRYTFGNMYLLEGIPLLPALIGLFAISEVLTSADEAAEKTSSEVIKFSAQLPTFQEVKRLWVSIFRSCGIGTVIGILPGAGATIASIISYNEAKRFSKKPEDFGKGNPEGIVASEAANNASVGGALVPLLTLSIPGSPSAAIMIGAFMLHGIMPGPWLFEENVDLVYGIFVSLFLSNIAMLVIGLGATKFWTKIIGIPDRILHPIVLGLCLVGCYAVTGNLFGVWLGLGFGILGAIMKRLDFSVTPVVLALVLGELVEISLRRSLVMSHGSYAIFIKSPVCAVILFFALFSFVWPFIQNRRNKGNKVAKEDSCQAQ